MLRRLLDAEAEHLLREERATLAYARDLLARIDHPPAGVAPLAQAIAQLDELFSIVVVGDFNSGKSALLNALLGVRLLEEGVTPTTQRLHLLRYGERSGTTLRDDGVAVVEAAVELLRDLNLVDTPGTNAIARHHETLTRDFLPRADLVLFVTSADRPFTESERAFLAAISEWGRKVVLVINKSDLLGSDADREQVRNFVARACLELLGFSPALFLVSAKLGLGEKLAPGGDSGGSGLAALESHLVGELDQAERLRLKLRNPLRVALRQLELARVPCQQRLELLRDDQVTLTDLERQQSVYREDMRREFGFRLGDIEKRLHQLQTRGDLFFDQTLRLARLPLLLDRTRTRREFELQVIGEMPREIERQVADLIDWMVSQELRQWRSIGEIVRRRHRVHGERIGGELHGLLESNRDDLLHGLGSAATRAIETYDRAAEAGRLAESVRGAVAGVALLEVGAVGLGAAVGALATTTAADVTGVLAAGTLAALGLFVIPAKRTRAKAALRERLERLRAALEQTLRTEFEQEIGRSLSRLEHTIAPYTRFVRGERQGLEEQLAAIEALRRTLDALDQRIEAL